MAKLKTNFRALLMKRYKIKEPARLPPQVKIAKDIGVSQSTISLWLNDKVSQFDDDMLVTMCKFLGCEVGELLYIEWNGERQPA
jgi:DNA-binding Xre family transcriptional regulator